MEVDASGDGIGYHGGARVRLAFTIPGERVRARVERGAAGGTRATVEAIVRSSPHRVQPRCRHFGPPDLCGGCTWQHIAYPEQLRLKTDLVRRLITAALPGRSLDVDPTLPSTPLDQPWGYRHKAHFVFADGSRLIMGHYRRGTRRVFQAAECPVHDPRANAFAFSLHAECARVRHSKGTAGTLRHVAVRCGARTGETMATLVVTRADDKRLRQATMRALDAPGAPESFHLNLHQGADPYIFGEETRHIRGPRHLRERVAGATFLISPTAFFQTNVEAAEILVRLVLAALPAGVPVLDLYAGVGLFAIPLARRGDSVIAVEENRAATAAGTASLQVNDVPRERCRFVAGRVLQVLRTRRIAASHVVLDPPRDGCEAAVLDEVFGQRRPLRAAYVSCNPEALAADLARIDRHGYRVERLQPVDMFPHTAHVETVAVLSRVEK